MYTYLTHFMSNNNVIENKPTIKRFYRINCKIVKEKHNVEKYQWFPILQTL